MIDRTELILPLSSVGRLQVAKSMEIEAKHFEMSGPPFSFTRRIPVAVNVARAHARFRTFYFKVEVPSRYFNIKVMLNQTFNFTILTRKNG